MIFSAGHLFAAVLLLCAFGQRISKADVLADINERQILSTIAVCSTTGSACLNSASSTKTSSTSKSSSKSTSSSKSSSSSLSTTTPKSSSSSTKTGPVTYNMVITTTFTQPPECTSDSVSRMVWDSGLWKNFIDPVPTSTYTSCFPSQFYSSVLAVASGTNLPAFTSLICPQNWEIYNFNTTYILCCPNGFGYITPNTTNTNRPGMGAICTSSVLPGALLDITSFGSSSFVTVMPITVGVNGTLVLADAYDGIAATITSSQPSTSTSKISTVLSSSSSKISTSSSTAGTTSKATSTSTSSVVSASSKTSSSSKPSSTGFSYLGCYTEGTSGRALSSDTLVNHTTMTIEICEAYCSAYTYAGLEYYGECFCGNSFAAGSVPAPETDCVDPCDGNTAQTCGGGNRLSVWKKN